MLRAYAPISVFVVLALAGCDRSTVEDDGPSPTTATGTGGSGDGGSGATSQGGQSQGGEGGMGQGGMNQGGAFSANCDASSVLISELAVLDEEREFIEIWNTGNAAVDLSGYYLSDNSGYYSVGAGDPWDPETSNPGTDFAARFPTGTMIAGNSVLTVQAGSGTGFFDTYGVCPDFTLAATDCGGGAVPLMAEAPNGGIGSNAGTLLSNDREMVILFCWDGGSIVKDVDYVTWGSEFEEPTRVDKSDVAGYEDDTAKASQLFATPPVFGKSLGRCDATEDEETATGGNGISGADETSENMGTSFTVFDAPSPGTVNSCGN